MVSKLAQELKENAHALSLDNSQFKSLAIRLQIDAGMYEPESEQSDSMDTAVENLRIRMEAEKLTEESEEDFLDRLFGPDDQAEAA